MNEGFLDRQIRRTNRNVLVFNLVILGVLLFVAVVTAKYYYNFFLGPFPIASEQFDDQGNPKSLHEFFTIDSINLDPSRFSLDETDHGHTTNYPFYELAIGPKQMLVKMASRSYSGTLTGGPQGGFLRKLPRCLMPRITRPITPRCSMPPIFARPASWGWW